MLHEGLQRFDLFTMELLRGLGVVGSFSIERRLHHGRSKFENNGGRPLICTQG